jgi:hypothetical protein
MAVYLFTSNPSVAHKLAVGLLKNEASGSGSFSVSS